MNSRRFSLIEGESGIEASLELFISNDLFDHLTSSRRFSLIEGESGIEA